MSNFSGCRCGNIVEAAALMRAIATEIDRAKGNRGRNSSVFMRVFVVADKTPAKVAEEGLHQGVRSDIKIKSAGSVAAV
jgi:hypothetical protein